MGNGILISHKKKLQKEWSSDTFTTQMNFDSIMLSEKSHEGQIPYDSIYVKYME
jgi:hypothetical protein